MHRKQSRCMLFIMLLIGVVIILSTVCVFAEPISDESRFSYDMEVTRPFKTDLKRLMVRFEKLLEYFEANYKKVNLDGLFGIRMAQTVLKRDSSESKVLRSLTRRIDTLAEHIMHNVEATSPNYFVMFQNLIDQPFLTKRVIRIKPQVDELITRSASMDYEHYDSNFDEQFSDECFSSLLQKQPESCGFSDKCFRFFSDPSASGYYLTHQLLYFLIAEHAGCSSTLLPDFAKYIAENSSTRPLLASVISSIDLENIHELQSRILSYYCTKVYQESKALYEKYDRDASNFERDLFIEQIILCGILKMDEFLNEKWMNLIFSFQNRNGCFGSGFNYRDEVVVESRKRRSKRYDAYMDHEGCSSHESGLAFAYYAIMIDHLIQQL